MMTAMLTARNILAGERIYDIWQVNEDAEYHEAGAAGAQEALASERLVPRKAGPRSSGGVDGSPTRTCGRAEAASRLSRPSGPGSARRGHRRASSRRRRCSRRACPRRGQPFSVRMTNCGPLGWVSDQTRLPLSAASSRDRRAVAADAGDRCWRRGTDLAGYPHPPEACLINVYAPDRPHGAAPGSRRAATSRRRWYRCRSVRPACFRIGGTARRDPTRSFRLASGDALVLGGEARLAFHGVDRIICDTSTLLPDGSRINLTLRRVNRPV